MISKYIEFIGICVVNLFQTIKYIFKGNAKISSIMQQAAIIGYDSLSIAIVIVFVAGAVISLQLSKQFLMTGGEAYVGGFVAVAIIREIAPAFTALAIGARAGTAIAAEIANMQVTEQIDAIKTLKVDDIGYLFAPRLIAGLITVPMVVILTEILGILGGLLVSNITIALHPNRYINSAWLYTKPYDIYVSLIKGAVFGVLITLVCATQGYLTKGGAKEVGISTTKAAILSTIAMLLCDYVLNWVFYL